MSDYNEHLISMAGGDGDESARDLSFAAHCEGYGLEWLEEEEAAMSNYDALLSRESQSRERIAKALFELDMQRSRDQYSPSAIRHILEGGET